jgi:hypothetical protein
MPVMTENLSQMHNSVFPGAVGDGDIESRQIESRPRLPEWQPNPSQIRPGRTIS